MPSRLEIRFDELEAYLAAKPESLRAFGRRARIDKMTLHRLVTGKMKRFDPDLVQRIADNTAQIVGHEQFAAFIGRLTAKQRPLAGKQLRRKFA